MHIFGDDRQAGSWPRPSACDQPPGAEPYSTAEPCLLSWAMISRLQTDVRQPFGIFII